MSVNPVPLPNLLKRGGGVQLPAQKNTYLMNHREYHNLRTILTVGLTPGMGHISTDLPDEPSGVPQPQGDPDRGFNPWHGSSFRCPGELSKHRRRGLYAWHKNTPYLPYFGCKF